MLVFIFAALFLGVIALTPIENRFLLTPTVVIKNGTVVGSTSGFVDSFRGIPFAQPPTGTLRLKPPQTITKTFGTFTATAVPTACPQFLQQLDTTNLPDSIAAAIEDSPLYQNLTKTGEDCLTLNVQRPSTASASSKLPVLFWIFGGGFEFGSTQTYDGTGIIQQSMVLAADVIYVTTNYRVGGFGFLAGKQLQADGSTNLGLRDQRLALMWVQENIAAFGGDPTKVTIWGESAGSISVFDQTVINDGDNTYNGGSLFRGAIMDSGSIVPTLPVNHPKAQLIYDTVVQAAGCSGAADSLNCLRSISYQKFLEAANSVPGIFSYSSVNLAYLPRPDPNSTFYSRSPELSVSSGRFTKVPVIIGDQEDEGTLFSLVQNNLTTTDDVVNYIQTYFPNATRTQIAELVATYPDNPPDGSPFRTGYLNSIYPQYKRIAAILGDYTFTLQRRTYLTYVSKVVPAWSYLGTYFYGTPILGTFHASDVLEVYYNFVFPIPAYSIKTYYISFVNFLNPNTLSNVAPLINWPQWDNKTLSLLNFEAFQNSILKDDFRNVSFAYLFSHPSNFRV